MNQHADQPANSDHLWLLGIGMLVALFGFTTIVWGVIALSAKVQGGELQTRPGDMAGVVTDAARDGGNIAGAMPAADAEFVPPSIIVWIVAVAIAAVLVVLALRTWMFASSMLGGHGREKGAEWATGRARRRVVKGADRGTAATKRPGLVVGTSGTKRVRLSTQQSLLVIAPTRMGKTTNTVIPFLLEHPGSVFASSVKDDYIGPVIRRRRVLGDVAVFAPAGGTAHKTTPWTPLAACTTWAGTLRTAAALLSGNGEAKGKDRFWDDQALGLLEPLLHAAALDDRRMRDVAKWVNTREEREVLRILAEHDAEDASIAFESIIADAQVTKDNTYSSARNALRVYRSPELQDPSIDESLDVRMLLNSGSSILVAAPSEDQKLYRPLFSAFTATVLNTCRRHAAEHGPFEDGLLVMLDEAMNIAPIEDLDTQASTCGGYGIQLATMIQSYSQLVTAYGASRAESVWENHTALMVLGGSKGKTLHDQLTKLMGDQVQQETSVTMSASGRSHSTSAKYRPLLTPDQLQQLPEDQALFLTRNNKPLMIQLRSTFNDSGLKELQERGSRA